MVLPKNEIFDLYSNIDFLRKLNNPDEDQNFEYTIKIQLPKIIDLDSEYNYKNLIIEDLK